MPNPLEIILNLIVEPFRSLILPDRESHEFTPHLSQWPQRKWYFFLSGDGKQILSRKLPYKSPSKRFIWYLNTKVVLKWNYAMFLALNAHPSKFTTIQCSTLLSIRFSKKYFLTHPPNLGQISCFSVQLDPVKTSKISLIIGWHSLFKFLSLPKRTKY